MASGEPTPRVRAVIHRGAIANPTTGRILVWAEKGTWSVSGRAEVPYMLSSEGLTDAEFWQIANGLHPNQI